MDRMAMAKEEDFKAWHDELFSPLTGQDPDKVTQDVVEDEMAAFMALTRQTSGGGGS